MSVFVTRPVSLVLFLLIVAALGLPPSRGIWGESETRPGGCRGGAHAMKLLGTPLVEYAPPAVLLLVSIGFLAMAYGFNADSAAMPLLIGWAMIVLTALDLVTRMRVPLGDALTRALNPSSLAASHEPPTPSRTLRQATAIGALVVFVAAMLLVGVLPCVPVFTLVALRFGAGKSWLFSVVGALGMLLLIWAVFAKLLGLDIFPGLLFDGDW